MANLISSLYHEIKTTFAYGLSEGLTDASDNRHLEVMDERSAQADALINQGGSSIATAVAPAETAGNTVEDFNRVDAIVRRVVWDNEPIANVLYSLEEVLNEFNNVDVRLIALSATEVSITGSYTGLLRIENTKGNLLDGVSGIETALYVDYNRVIKGSELVEALR